MTGGRKRRLCLAGDKPGLHSGYGVSGSTGGGWFGLGGADARGGGPRGEAGRLAADVSGRRGRPGCGDRVLGCLGGGMRLAACDGCAVW